MGLVGRGGGGILLQTAVEVEEETPRRKVLEEGEA